MAVANTKSLVVTARDATPNLLTPYGGVVKTVGGTIATLAADDDGSVYRMCRLSSSARILAIRTTNGTVTGGTDYDFGAYQTAANGGAVVDKDALVGQLQPVEWQVGILDRRRLLLVDFFNATVEVGMIQPELVHFRFEGFVGGGVAHGLVRLINLGDGVAGGLECFGGG